VLFTADPIDLEAFVDGKQVVAVIHAFYPEIWGGKALAEILAGRVSPGGRMPYSWPRGLADVGAVSDYTMTGTSKTYRYWKQNKTFDRFPFGYGLSYTTFHYSNLSVNPSVAKTCQNITLKVVVQNTGSVFSDEVVQAYAHWRNAPTAPQRQLVGFERVSLAPGSSAEVTLTVKPEQLALVQEAQTPDELPIWMAVPVDIDFTVGGQQPSQLVSAPSNLLKVSAKVGGRTVPVDDCGQEVVVV